MLPLAVLLLTAAPKGPPPSDMAQLYFLAGDLKRAVDTARQGLKVEPLKCKPLFPLLVEYEYLAQRSDRLTTEEARQLLELDRKISPKAQGKLTGPVVTRHVDDPLRVARLAVQAGELEKARKLLQTILLVDPSHEDSKTLLQSLPPADAGR